ncbi:outer membrane lipoprotein carrier protein LolA [Trinickia sp. YCB016]
MVLTKLKRFAAVGIVLSAALCVANVSLLRSAQAASPSDDARLVSQIAAHLAQAPGIRAQFKQTQTLAALRAPLVSTGTLLFMRERGVIWQIDSPIRTTYVISDSGVTEIDANGKRIARAARSAGGAAQVSRMIRAMLGGDLSALYSQFDVTASGTPKQWQMQLTPNQPQLAQMLKGLRMAGGDFLQTLTITSANGDATRIDFTNNAAVAEPSSAERALFGAN